MMNSKKILEFGNETIALTDNISETIFNKNEELSTHFENENKEIKGTLEEAVKKMEEKITSLFTDDIANIMLKSKDCSNDLLKINTELKESKNKIIKGITSLKDENEDLKTEKKRMDERMSILEHEITNINKGMKSLKDENEELKRANKILNTKITTLEVVTKFSVLGEWKVCFVFDVIFFSLHFSMERLFRGVVIMENPGRTFKGTGMTTNMDLVTP